MRNQERKVKWKMIFLVACVFILLGTIIFNQYRRSKEREEYQKTLTEKEEAEEKKIKEEAEKEEQEAENPENPLEETESSSEETKSDAEETGAGEEGSIAITNLQEVATPVMGSYDKSLETRLSEFKSEYGLSSKEAEIFQVLVPEDNPSATEFYVRIDDKERIIVKLVWHSKERVVTASECTLSEEEIAAQARGDNGPDNRDISAEEEESLRQEQEDANEPEGEN